MSRSITRQQTFCLPAYYLVCVCICLCLSAYVSARVASAAADPTRSPCHLPQTQVEKVRKAKAERDFDDAVHCNLEGGNLA